VEVTAGRSDRDDANIDYSMSLPDDTQHHRRTALPVSARMEKVKKTSRQHYNLEDLDTDGESASGSDVEVVNINDSESASGSDVDIVDINDSESDDVSNDDYGDLDFPCFKSSDHIYMRTLEKDAKRVRFFLKDTSYDKFLDVCGDLLKVDMSAQSFVNIFKHPSDFPHLLATNDESDFTSLLNTLKPLSTIYVGKHEFMREATISPSRFHYGNFGGHEVDDSQPTSLVASLPLSSAHPSKVSYSEPKVCIPNSYMRLSVIE
jgi:hypothetical protein